VNDDQPDRPPRVIRLFGYPDPDPTAAIDLLSAQPELDGAAFKVVKPGTGEVMVTVHGATDRAWALVQDVFAKRHPHEVFSRDGQTVDDLVGRLLVGHRLMTIESCTVGILASRLMTRPGSGAYSVGGFVAYAAETKRLLLGVPDALLVGSRVYSARTAEAMARGVLALDSLRLDVAVAVSGVAGPTGGSDEAPVGTVAVCAMQADGDHVTCRLQLPGGPAEVRRRATTLSVHALRALLSTEPFGVPRIDT
jgi:nicotinamide-nucleotide amidase